MENIKALTEELENLSKLVGKKNSNKAKKLLNNCKDQLKKIEDQLNLQVTFKKEQQLIGKNYSKKMSLVMEFLRSIEIFLDVSLTGGVFGSFVRQIFEIPFAMEDGYKENSFANPIGHDLDIVLFTVIPHQITIHNIIKFMELTEQYIRFVDSSNGNVNYPMFGEYRLVEIKNTTVTEIKHNFPFGKKSLYNIPKFVAKFVDSNNKMTSVDILSWLPGNTGDTWRDFDTNCLVMTKNGIMTHNNTNFFSVLNHIKRKECECLVDVEGLQSILKQGIPRIHKIPYLSTISQFMSNRLKILANGYDTITSSYSVPCFDIETIESCPITNCEPPYINITLCCNHKLSIAAYTGLVFKSDNPDSESIKCPYCRGEFLIKMIDKKPSTINFWSPKINKKIKVYTPEYATNSKVIISDECKKMIVNYYSEVSSDNRNITNQTFIPGNIIPENGMSIPINNMPINNIPVINGQPSLINRQHPNNFYVLDYDEDSY